MQGVGWGPSGVSLHLCTGHLQPQGNKTSQSPTCNDSAHNSGAPVLPPDQAPSSSSLHPPASSGDACAEGQAMHLPYTFREGEGRQVSPTPATTLPVQLLGF